MSYESDSPTDRLAAVRASIQKVLNSQEWQRGPSRVQYAQLNQLRAMEKDLMAEVAASSGSGSCFTIGRIERSSS